MKTNSPEDTELIVQQLPGDLGIHRNPRKGTLNAPEALLEDFEFDEKVFVDEVFPDEFDLDEAHRRIEANTKELLDYVRPILSIGGDHSVSYAAVKALKERYPNLQLVWLDAHLDVKEKVDGNVSHDVVVRELLEHGFSEDEIWIVGVTQVDHDEEEFIEDSGLNIYMADELQEFVREFKQNEQPVYLSVDIDALKEELAPGTGYPDGKLELDDVEKVIDTVQPDHADLVEVAPSLDKKDKTVENGRKILEMLEKRLIKE